jgi:3-methylcrotonyl-CoA carboxylase alpha subunit
VAARTRRFRDDEGEHRVEIGDDGRVTVDGGGPVAARVLPDGAIRIGEDPAVVGWVAAEGDVRWVFIDGEVFRFDIARDGRKRARTGQHGSLSAPMPATVLKVRVAPGEEVAAGATLIILEAMKMELPVRAPAAGKVTAVHCREGELVQPGVTLIELE